MLIWHGYALSFADCDENNESEQDQDALHNEYDNIDTTSSNKVRAEEVPVQVKFVEGPIYSDQIHNYNADMFVPEELELTVNSELDHDELHLECDNGDTVVASKVFSDDEIPAEYQMSKINTDSFDAQQIHIYHSYQQVGPLYF